MFNHHQIQSQWLKEMLHQAQAVNELNEQLKDAHPDCFNETISVVLIRGSLCVLAADSNAHAYRAKQNQQILLAKLRAHPDLAHITHLEIKTVIKPSFR